MGFVGTPHRSRARHLKVQREREGGRERCASDAPHRSHPLHYTCTSLVYVACTSRYYILYTPPLCRVRNRDVAESMCIYQYAEICVCARLGNVKMRCVPGRQRPVWRNGGAVVVAASFVYVRIVVQPCIRQTHTKQAIEAMLNMHDTSEWFGAFYIYNRTDGLAR